MNKIQLSIILFFCLTLNACVSYKAVEIKEIKSVEPLNNDISSGKLIVSIRVANPNNYAIKVKKYDLHAFVDNIDLGQVDVGGKIVLPKHSDQEYKLAFAPDLSKILSALPSIFLKGRAEVALKGSVRIKASLLSRKFEVDLKKKVSASDFR